MCWGNNGRYVLKIVSIFNYFWHTCNCMCFCLLVELDDINQQLEFANQKVANSDKLAKEAEAERHQMIGSVNQKDLALQKEAAKFQRFHNTIYMHQ